jgi:N-acetylneuraminic acid mutarotase
MSQIDRRVFLAAAGAMAAVPFSACAREPSPGWTAKASLPWPVQEIYCAVSDGKIVTAGGLVGRPDGVLHIEDRTALYDPAADAWSEGPRLPAPRHHPMLIAGDDGRVRVFGGYGRSGEGDWTAMTDVWMLEADGWAPAGQMPQRLCETVGVSVGGRMHLVTGRSPAGAANGQWRDQADVAAHLAYVPEEDRWETARPCPMARNSAAAAVLDGAIWVAGGRTVSGGGTGRLDRYDPAADRWDTLAPIPPSPATGQQVGGGLAMAAANGKLVAFGGEWFAPGGGGVFAETWIYDPAADRWEAGPAMRTPRHGLATAAVGGTVYAIAGGEVVSGGRAGGVVEALAI